MRWLTVFCATLALGAAGVHGQEEFADLGFAPGLIRAAAPPPAGQQQHDQGGGNQGQASGGQTHGGNGGKAVQAADNSNNKNGNGNKGAKAGEAHDAGKSGTHDKAPTSTTKDGAHHGDSKDAHADKKSDNNHGKDDGEHKNKNKPSKTRKLSEDDDLEDEGDDEAEKEYLKRVKADKDAGKLPGRMKMVVPPRTVHTPLFELDSVVELKWEYDNNVIEVPEKLMISVQLPKDPHDPSSKPVIYDIATNVTGKKKSFFWDTKNDVPEGVGMREGSGYTMFFYDGDIGFRMSDVVPAGYLIKYAMPFAFYISRYERTNDGVPRNYNPNAAARPVPAIGLTAVLLLVASAVAHCWIG
ncbi:hypothetical protein LPJ73_001132 [Coemansia sp. RSA 2703]|nr:hypothetical protein LPJ73_001132 [Coemansia sp. RSA 2703]KAJ2395162.1 hypothetical protein GGI05_001714 [Coemansia sp. RSA 2603]